MLRANGHKSKITNIHFFIPKEYTLIAHHGEEYNVRTTCHETILDLAFIVCFENMIS